MTTQKRFQVLSLAGLLLTAAGTFAYAAASEAEAMGVGSANAESSGDGGSPVRHSQIKLVLDHDGDAEQLELADLHELEVGESRSFATASGTPVVVTRDAEGFEIDLDGKKIRLMDQFEGDGSGTSWTSAGGGTRTFHKRVIVTEGEDEDGEANVMILRNKVAVDSNGVAIADAESHVSGHDVVMMRRRAPEGSGFAFTTGDAADGELPAIALPVEATIHRLESSAKFQELDAATRAKVLEALRESAPNAGTFVRQPGARTIVLEIEDDSDEAN